MTDTGEIDFVTPEEADEHARLPGFGKALDAVNWAIFNERGIQILNWDRHNGTSAKKRYAETERKRRQRAGNEEE